MLFAGLTSLNAYFGETTLLRWGEIINAVGFLFEYLLGVGVQVYLVSLCFVWVRGIHVRFPPRFAASPCAGSCSWCAGRPS